MWKWLIILFSLVVATPANAQTGFNAGLVQGIWYSEPNFFAGDEIRVYAAIHNQGGSDLVGNVGFFTGEELIDTSEFNLISGRLLEVWADWVAIEGDHQVSVRLSDVKKVEIGQDPEPIELEQTVVASDHILVDADTDGDGIGNELDGDDDNDGFTDEEEEVNGTDPLVVDEGAGEVLASQEIQEEVVDQDDRDLSEDSAQDQVVAPLMKGVRVFIEKSKDISEDLTEKLEEKKIALETEKEEDKGDLKALASTTDLGSKTLVSSEKTTAAKKTFLSVAIAMVSQWWVISAFLILVVFFILRILFRVIKARKFNIDD